MKQLELTSQVSELWTRLDQMRSHRASNRPLESVIAPFTASLFLLRWADHMDIEQEAADAFDDRDSLPVLPRDQHWSSWCDLRGERLVDVLRREILPALRNAPNSNLGYSLQRLVPVVEDLASEPPELIETLIQWSQTFNLETVTGRQAAGDALAALVEETTEKGAKIVGQYTTPRSIVEMMADLLDPSPGERIYDPCFGTGGLLATVANRLHEKAMSMPSKVWTEVQQQSVFGIEINPSAYSIGLARVVLAGIDYPKLELGDALERPLAKDRSSEGFDCIMAVSPWGGRARPETANLETLFLQHVMASLRPGGRAVIALPDGALFRTGPDQKVRKELLTDYCVEGVISLPAGAFHPYTGIKTSLVLFRREQAKQAVRFMQVEEWPFLRPEKGFSSRTAVTVAHVIAEEFRNGTPNGSPWLWETPIEKLATRDWELIAKQTGEEALSRSLSTLQEADAEVPVQPINEVAEVFVGASYKKSGTTPHGDDPSVFAGLVRVADVKRTGVQPPSLFLTKEGSERVKSKHLLRLGDILLTASGTIGKLGIVSEQSGTVGAVAAKNLIVIRPKERISPQFLKNLLASDTYQDWLHGHARGATIQHLSRRTLRDLPVPVPQVAIQERVVQQTGRGKKRSVVQQTGEERTRSAVLGGALGGALGSALGPLGAIMGAALGAMGSSTFLQNAEKRDDPIAALVHILTGISEDPVVEWLEGSPDVRELRQSRQATDPFVLLERIAHSAVETLRNQVEHEHLPTVPELARWLVEFTEAVRSLQGLNNVPPGAGLMAILDRALLRLERVQETIGESSLPALDSARDVTRKISRLVRDELDSILGDVELETEIEPNAVEAGTENEVQVRVKNLSPLALRNVSVSTLPLIGETRIGYLAEGEMHSFTANIPLRPETGPFQFELRWQADRLDGQTVSDKLPLAVDVRSEGEDVHPVDLGPSPYIVGSPIDREEMFFGRQDTINTIKRQLSTSNDANVILLEGNRRTGKTSILRHLEAPDVLPAWIVVNCSLQGAKGHESKTGSPTNDVFRHMARDIGWAMDNAGFQVWLPNVDSPDPNKRFKVEFVKALSTAFSGPHPFEVFKLYMQHVLEAASPRRLLLMFDEFDKLQEGIDAGITSPQVPENIRHLLHTYPGLSAILTGSRRLKRLREEYWSALFGFGLRVPVSELPLEDARLLVTQPVEGQLAYLHEARDRVVELCSRQPFLIQSLCNQIFEHAAYSDKRMVMVTERVVNTVAQEMVEDNEYFRTLWSYAGTERRRFVLALCQQLEGGPDPIILSFLEAKFEEYDIALPAGDRLGDDLEFLRELELLKFQDTARGSAYVLAVPLMANWIRQNIDFENQRQQAVQESGRG